jgi:hypothetical protein
MYSPMPSGAAAPIATALAGGVAGEPRAKHEPERGELAHRVPVGEWLLEPSLGADRVREVQRAREQTLRQAVPDHHESAPGECRLDRAQEAALAQQDRRGERRAEVHEHQLTGVIARRQQRPRGK